MTKPVKLITLLALIFMGVGTHTASLAANHSTETPKPSNELPILAWHSIPEKETTIERFKELRAAGFTHSFSNYSSVESLQKALDIAAQTGIKLIISCPELKKSPELVVKRFMKHKALAGYYLKDEPSAEEFGELGTWAKRIQALDKEHFCYLNLFPTYASLDQLKSASYRDHVQTYIREVPTQVLSFDHYPVVEGKDGLSLREDYYENMEIFADEASKAAKPFWAFSLAVAHKPYPIPDLAQMRLQMFSNLAYGAQALQYFTYWTPGKNPNWDFHHGPIGLDTKRTDVYDKVKELNKEIQGIRSVFQGCKVLQVRHAGSYIPKATTQLSTLPAKVLKLEVTPSNDKQAGALISEIQNKQNRYLIIVNRDFKNRMGLEISLDPSAKRILKDGERVPASTYSTKLFVDPGDLIIYQLD
jgi:hypothetical protein